MIGWLLCKLGSHRMVKSWAWGHGGYPVWACVRCGLEVRR